MDKPTVLHAFEALSSSARLDVYLLLVAAGPNGLVAGELASRLDLPPSNLSFHLKNLSQAGLVTVAQEGRFQRYRANLVLMRDVTRFLADHCCGGHPEQCPELDNTASCKPLSSLSCK
ncbi:helix-turn-helix transcriptional regulator [Chitinimonas arctica]|uniref:Helix-turn-helix transcriptional regulator n=1 Tax=Chitinimonas arctica TaxID=2594795 RepID=A0A516SD56_9NEIS|nr:helix-turn-helix transcriptional regulator [Chitinimonas arctica]QDQ26089.1 helix-turn-helix transcriptional regulator [Chitinimonas arctica]